MEGFHCGDGAGSWAVAVVACLVTHMWPSIAASCGQGGRLLWFVGAESVKRDVRAALRASVIITEPPMGGVKGLGQNGPWLAPGPWQC